VTAPHPRRTVCITKRLRHKLLGGICLTAAVLAVSGCAGTVRSDPQAHGDPAKTTPLVGPPGQGTIAGNRAAAEQEAAALLKTLRLPRSAVHDRVEPSGDDGYLRPSPGFDGDSAHATAYRWWVLPETVAQVIGYLNTHVPPGASEGGTGAGTNVKTGTSDMFVDYAWPSVSAVFGSLRLQVTATALPDGGTGVLAQAQADWTVPRSASEKVPAGVTAVRVRLQRPPKWLKTFLSPPIRTRPSKPSGSRGLGPVLHAVITNQRNVARAIRLVNSLGVVQPILLGCPIEGVPGVPAGSLTVTYSAGPAGPALAQAKVQLLTGVTDSGAGPCDPIEFSVRGHVEKALLGASFVTQIEKLAGLSQRS
jgi:hypothetical protein